MRFRHDVLWIARSEPSPNHAGMVAEPTELFLQKSWTAAKRALAFTVAELPLLPGLLRGEESVLELVAHHAPSALRCCNSAPGTSAARAATVTRLP